MVVHAYYMGGIGERTGAWGQPWAKKHKTLPEKLLKPKWAGNLAQVVENLPSKYEAMSSNSSTIKKREKVINFM
jgi:hypothetical protein